MISIKKTVSYIFLVLVLVILMSLMPLGVSLAEETEPTPTPSTTPDPIPDPTPEPTTEPTPEPTPALSSNANLASIMIDGVPLSGFSPDITSYVEYFTFFKEVTITATPQDPGATVSGVGTINNGRSHSIKVTAEDGSYKRYHIQLYCTFSPPDIDQWYYINYDYSPTNGFLVFAQCEVHWAISPVTYSYTVTVNGGPIPADMSFYRDANGITVYYQPKRIYFGSMHESATFPDLIIKAAVTYDGHTFSTSQTINSVTVPSPYDFYKNGLNGYGYTQSFYEFMYNSSNNYLTQIYIDGEPIAFSYEGDTSVTLYRSTIDTISITAKPDDASAAVSGTGVKSISEGMNRFVLTVKAVNGDTRDYVLNIEVYPEDPATTPSSSPSVNPDTPGSSGTSGSPNSSGSSSTEQQPSADSNPEPTQAPPPDIDDIGADVETEKDEETGKTIVQLSFTDEFSGDDDLTYIDIWYREKQQDTARLSDLLITTAHAAGPDWQYVRLDKATPETDLALDGTREYELLCISHYADGTSKPSLFEVHPDAAQPFIPLSLDDYDDALPEEALTAVVQTASRKDVHISKSLPTIAYIMIGVMTAAFIAAATFAALLILDKKRQVSG